MVGLDCKVFVSIGAWFVHVRVVPARSSSFFIDEMPS
jgi:hypothetical protein